VTVTLLSSSMLSQSHSCHLPCCQSHSCHLPCCQSHSCHLPCCHSHTLVIFHVVTVTLLSSSMLSVTLLSSSMLSQSHSCHLPCCHSHTLVIFHVVTVALLSNHTSSYYTSWDLTKFYHNTSYFINVRENLRGNQGIDNPETLAKYMHTTYFISFENLLFILLIAPLY
jgi:hypothetical protein